MSTPLPPLLASRNGRFLPGKMSPEWSVRRDGKTIQVSPPVCPRPKWYRSTWSFAVPERHPLREGLGRESAAHRIGEDVGRRFRPPAVGPHHLHVRLRYLVGDDVDVGGERDVAAHVVVVTVRVDEGRHRIAGELGDRVEDRRPPAGVLRVDDDNPVTGDEDGRVPAAPLSPQDVQVVLELLDLDDHLLCGDDSERQDAGADHDGQNDAAFHVCLPVDSEQGAHATRGAECARNGQRSTVLRRQGGAGWLTFATPRRPWSY